jgi:hypothetical protein
LDKLELYGIIEVLSVGCRCKWSEGKAESILDERNLSPRYPREKETKISVDESQKEVIIHSSRGWQIDHKKKVKKQLTDAENETIIRQAEVGID